MVSNLHLSGPEQAVCFPLALRGGTVSTQHCLIDPGHEGQHKDERKESSEPGLSL